MKLSQILKLEGHSLERIPSPKPKNSKLNNLIVEKLKALTTPHLEY